MRRQGFTLLEISMVVVIIALVAAGIFVGRTLIRQSEINKGFSEYEQVVTAMQTFRGKYNCMAGDCAKATEFFGDRGDCPDLSTASFGAPATYESNQPADGTCDGDGDKRIDGAKTVYEMTTLWQHLSNAGVYSGTYTGGLIADRVLVPGLNIPATTVRPGYGWGVLDGDNSVLISALTGYASFSMTGGKVGTVMVPLGFALNDLGPLTPAEAYSFDLKFDDGKPATGKIQIPVSLSGAPVYCVDSADETVTDTAYVTAEYLSGDAAYKDIPSCSPMMLTGF